LKTAFDIIPQPDNNHFDHLLVEAGWEGISFAWYTKAPFHMDGVLTCHFGAQPTILGVVAGIKNILETNPVFQQAVPAVSLCLNFKESILVPEQYFTEASRTDMLELMYGPETDVVVHSEKISDTGMVNVYRVPTAIMAVLQDRFPGAVSFHSTSLQLVCARLTDSLTCIVTHNSIKVIAYKAGELQIVQQFPYNTSADVVYHLLNTCHQYGMAANDTKVILSGMIDERSNLYNEIYKYFLHTGFETLPADISLAAGIGQYPAHFFSHLISLAVCAS
jgi:hypothetical protein